tara:strand:- start:93 stop:773 length:681 start_codon:yes stop_codon:yes gene_type:complete
MKLTENTVNVLKNFSTINPNLLVKEGSTITTMSAMKNILAKADVDEQFNQQFAIYDLNEFLSSTSLFKEPVIDFQDQYLTIKEEAAKGTKLNYFYSDPSVVTSPSKMITMPSVDVCFEITSDTLNQLKKAASVIQAPDLVLKKENGQTTMTVSDKKNDTANNYSIEVNTTSDKSKSFEFYYKVENLKLLPGTYDVSVSSKNISHFKSKTNNVEYWIALEPESKYEG